MFTSSVSVTAQASVFAAGGQGSFSRARAREVSVVSADLRPGWDSRQL
jgi:hypothetical protein